MTRNSGTENRDHSEQGVLFPSVNGRRSTQATAREVLADAARVADPRLADAIGAERDWRRRYPTYLRGLTALGATSAQDEMAVARTGLAALHRRFVFRRDERETPLADPLPAPASLLTTAVVSGDVPRATGLTVPYRGRLLRGDELHRQLDDWVGTGVVEPSFADAIRLVMANPDWLDLSGQWFALLGAAAEMGPLTALCRWGADVIAVDVPNAAVTSRIVAAARQGSGRVHLPARGRVGRDDAAVVSAAGADLVTELPEARAWLASFDVPLTLGNYGYAGGATFARLAMAADVLVADLLARRSDASVAYLATPTDVFAVPEGAVTEARRRVDGSTAARAVHASLRGVSAGRLYVPSYRELVTTDDGRRVGIADALVVQQGPSYALAKRLQRWRATLARSSGVVTSANVAPPTRTRSVVRNRVLAMAYAGAHRYGVEVFEPATSSTLMAALLVHDLRNPAALAQPGVPLANPADLLMENAAHGGLWRIGWEARSVLGLAVVAGVVRRR